MHIYAATQPLSTLPSVHHQPIHPSVHLAAVFYEALLVCYKDLSDRLLWSKRFLTRLLYYHYLPECFTYTVFTLITQAYSLHGQSLTYVLKSDINTEIHMKSTWIITSVLSSTQGKEITLDFIMKVCSITFNEVMN